MPEIYRKEHGSAWPWQGVLLYALPLPLAAVAVRAFSTGDSAKLMVTLVALACLWGGAALNRSGLRAEAIFRRRRIAAAPRTPRKVIAAIVIGIGSFISAAAVAQLGMISGVIAGLAAAAGTVLAYGVDPRGDKIEAGSTGGYSTEEIVSALTQAEAKIQAIEESSREIQHPEYSGQLRRIAQAARAVLTTIEDDPGDLRRARKFLHVYLDGARSVTANYARTHEDARNETVEKNFGEMLETIESSFVETRERLLQDDAMNLDVQIEVLTTRLKREGVV
ncbi:MAG: 5-bromo-4-chloroindolyl phosphate hydrolysis family protein [Gammaproteobacteria bacterium]